MRHSKKRLQINRFTSWYKATVISLARSVILYQNIRTTPQKARAARPLVEKLIWLAKSNTLGAKRQAYKILGEHKLVSMLFKEIGPLFAKRQSGFTRTIGLGKRRGDNAELVIFELTEKKAKEPKKQKKEKAPKPAVVSEAAPAEGQEKEPPVAEKKAEARVQIKETPVQKKPTRKFFGGLRNIFKKERDSL